MEEERANERANEGENAPEPPMPPPAVGAYLCGALREVRRSKVAAANADRLLNQALKLLRIYCTTEP